jgi:biopolymer transport protein ExbD
MRIRVRTSDLNVEPDWTPMIDMTFQLIAFFMVVLNFSESEQNELIKLPSSVLARPPEVQNETRITLQLADDGRIFLGGRVIAPESVPTMLAAERDMLERRQKTVDDALIIIRADSFAATGKVQELIDLSQRAGFERFVLRARQEG